MSSPPRLLFIFLDGVGLGVPDSAANPFITAGPTAFDDLLGGPLASDLPAFSRGQFLFSQLDATLAVAGLPQSATGQSTLLTGKNAARVMGAHYGPWPGPTLRRLLGEGNLFSASVSSGAGAAIANMYPPPYFRSLDQGRQRVNAPVHAALTAGLQLRQTADFEAGQAVSADLTGEYLARMHPGSRVVSPEQSGRELRSLAGRYGFTFFDFWLSDQVGHRGTLADAEDLVRKLARFLAAAVEPHDDGVTVIVTSDHGNLEDKSVRTHTRAPVPLLVSGPAADQFAGVTDLTGVAPAVSRVLGLELSRHR